MLDPKKNVIISDLDGTIALIQHRRHFVENGNKQWDEFHAACVDDVPNLPVITLLQTMAEEGYIINIFSGRSDAVRNETEFWLYENSVPYDSLLMRTSGDYTPDTDLKRSWINDDLRKQVLFVLDDRNRLVRMWREEGFTCLQVAEGKF